MEVSLFCSDLIDQPGRTIKRLYDTHQSFSVRILRPLLNLLTNPHLLMQKSRV